MYAGLFLDEMIPGIRQVFRARFGGKMPGNRREFWHFVDDKKLIIVDWVLKVNYDVLRPKYGRKILFFQRIGFFHAKR